MALALAEYTPGGQFSSDGNAYLNFHVTFVDPETIQQTTTDIQVVIPSGSTTDDIHAAIAAEIRRVVLTDLGFTLEEGDIFFPAFVKA